jgi:hypothetical protein
MSKAREFVLIVPLTSAEPAPGKVLLTGKFLDGMRSYVERWNGTVRVILPPGRGVTGNLDDVVVDRADLRSPSRSCRSPRRRCASACSRPRS